MRSSRMLWQCTWTTVKKRKKLLPEPAEGCSRYTRAEDSVPCFLLEISYTTRLARQAGSPFALSYCAASQWLLMKHKLQGARGGFPELRFDMQDLANASHHAGECLYLLRCRKCGKHAASRHALGRELLKNARNYPTMVQWDSGGLENHDNEWSRLII